MLKRAEKNQGPAAWPKGFWAYLLFSMQMTILLTISYTFRAVKEVFFGPLKPHLDADTVKDPPLTMSIPLLFVAAVPIFSGCIRIMDFLHLVIGKV